MKDTIVYDSESAESREPLLGCQHQHRGTSHWPNFGTMKPADVYGHEDHEASESTVRGLSPWRLLCLTISMGGLQTIWTSIMAQGSPYLASLGMSPSLISLVWLSGPLSGMFIQPYIGVLSDNCTFRWGRRKTFIVFGTIATSVFMVALPWTRNMVEFLFSCLGGNPTGPISKAITKFVAALIISILKISLQPVQCGIRALIVDCCPKEQQHQASAYASRVIGIGSIVGYGSGFVDFPSVFPYLGNTQFQVLCVLCCMCLVATVVLQCMTIPEKKLEYHSSTQRSKDLGVFGPLKQGLRTAGTMPKRIRCICIVQFFSWLSWFSFMYYITTYIGALYRQESPAADGAATIDPTRFGTVSMLAFASTATFVSLTLPRYVSAASGSPSHLLKDKESSDRKDLTLPRAWLIANLLAAMSFLLLGMTNSSVSATVVTGVLGVSWALTQWAPFALIGEELAKIRPQQSGHSRSSNNSDVEKLNVNSEEDNQTALILGIHNLAISAPQIVAAVGSSILFWFLEQCGVTGTDAIGWVLMFGAIPAGTAALWAFAVENED